MGHPVYVCRSIYLSIHLYIYLSLFINQSIYISINQSMFIRLSINQSFFLSIYQSIYPSIYQSINLYLSIYLSIYLFICLPFFLTCVSAHLFAYQSVYFNIIYSSTQLSFFLSLLGLLFVYCMSISNPHRPTVIYPSAFPLTYVALSLSQSFFAR